MLSLSNFAMHFYSLYYLVIIFSFNLLTKIFLYQFSYSTFHILFHLAAKSMFIFLFKLFFISINKNALFYYQYQIPNS